MDRASTNQQVALPGLPQVGEVINEKYLVEGLLGIGGMGAVFAARHLTLGQSVAIKVLSTDGGQQQDAVARFLREGQVAASLASDHVVRIYDIGQLDSGVPFMVMERLRGQDLATRVREGGALPVAEAVEFVAQVTMAIAEAHEAGIVHRDLKPANLFLTQRSDGTNCVKVLDFGISKQLSMFDTETLRADLTRTRQVMGSPAYMSPEQVRDARNIDFRTDIWAIGTTLYELLTGRVAFWADTLPAICAAIVADTPTPIADLRSDVPGTVLGIVERCLEKSPEARYPSARALLSALRAYQGLPDVVVSRRDESERLTRGTDVQLVAKKGRGAEPGDSGSRAASSSHRRRQPSVGDGGVEATLQSGERAVGSCASGDEPSLGVPQATRSSSTVVSADAEGSERSRQTSGRQLSRWPVYGRQLAILAAIGVGGLGTWWAWHGSRQAAEFSLRIVSVPRGATVFEGQRWLGETPLELPIRRQSVQNQGRRFTLRLEGYAPVEVEQLDSSHDRELLITLSKMALGQASEPSQSAAASAASPLPSSGKGTAGSVAARPRAAKVTNVAPGSVASGAAADPADIRLTR